MSAILDQRYTELQSLGTTIDSADALLAAKKFENAVSAYQVAGGQAVQLIAALNGGPSAAVNAQLQALQSHLASEQTAQQAQALAKQLQGIATSAYNTASAGATPTPVTSPVRTPTAATTSAPAMVLWVAVAIGVGTLLFLTVTDPRRR